MTKTEFLLTVLIQYQWKSDESEEKYQFRDYQLIKHQILQIDTDSIVWQTVKRIINEILGAKG